ncbi:MULTISPECIES: sensor histidine kinase [unclassified Microbacterium]|uniref:sensor histidine kinase n=1 Tax=unclassified Microbacterium TaxID=2609290 RepID=UPI00365446DF
MTDGSARALDRAASRWQRHPRWADALTTLSWVVLTTVPMFAAESADPAIATRPVGPWGIGLGLVVVAIVATTMMLFRRRNPVLLFLVSVTLPLVVLPFSLDVGAFAVAYAVFAIAVYDRVSRAWIAGAVAYAVTLVLSVVHLLTGFGFAPVNRSGSRLETSLTWAAFDLLILLVALLWGQNAGNRRRYVAALVERARILEHERDQEAQLAALAERSRIARDVHDIVSHSLSVIVRLADGTRAVFDADPVRAREAVGQIGGVARSSLDEMRRVLGVLERPTGQESTRSGTGLEDLPRLAEVYRGIGLPVRLDLDLGRPVPGEVPGSAAADAHEIPAGLQMTVFRIVQEALTNALRHAEAPTEVRVEVRVTEEVIHAEIRDDGATTPLPPDGARAGQGAPADRGRAGGSVATTVSGRVGRGLLGMRERAALYGGALDAGPAGSRGWAVRLALPRSGS